MTARTVDDGATLDTALLERVACEVIGGEGAVTFDGLLPSTESEVYRVAVGTGSVVVRLSSTDRRSECEVAAELSWLRHLARAGAPVAVFSVKADASALWTVSDVCQQAGVAFIPGVGEAVDAAGAKGERVNGLPADAHWNGRGHDIAAGVIGAWITAGSWRLK